MNYCSYLAENAASTFTDFAVYSNVDPTREWNGGPTLEFNEPDDATTKTTLSGSAFATHGVYAIARTPTSEDAEAILSTLSAYCESELDALAANGTIYAFAIDERGTAADVRGIVEGDSFYGFVKFSITERI